MKRKGHDFVPVSAAISFDHVGLVVDDLEVTAAFFTGLGFTRDDLGMATGAWVDRVVGIEGSVEEIVLISAPDGTGHIEFDEVPFADSGRRADRVTVEWFGPSSYRVPGGRCQRHSRSRTRTGLRPCR